MKENNSDDLRQRDFWKGAFGDEYVKRNFHTIEESNQHYYKIADITIEEILRKTFASFDKNISILELGCNIGLKLGMLEKMGFQNLYGVEINKSAFEQASKLFPKIKFFNSSIEDFESKDLKFDIVYTMGVLIHINPVILPEIIKKMIKLSNKYIFGHEYYSKTLEHIPYRKHENALWKQDFPKLFESLCPTLHLIKKEFFSNEDKNIDVAYLFEK